jgi:antitoxin VapB
MRTTLFKSGNSLAVRIPRELWPAVPGTAVELFREGDHLVVRPAEGSLEQVLEVFSGFDPDYMAQGREEGMEPERDW